MKILGISDNHDSGACLIKDGELAVAINEERLRRQKLVGGFPYLSIEEIFRISKVAPQDVDFIILASLMTPTSILRLLDSFHNNLRQRSSSFSYLLNLYIIYQLLVHKLKIPKAIESSLSIRIIKHKLSRLNIKAPVVCIDHHLAHAACAYYTSGFDGQTLIITADAMGDALSLTVNIGKEKNIERTFSQTGFSAISTYYSRITEFLGFRPLKHEGKITGLAGYGHFNKEIMGLAKQQLHFIEEKRAFNLKNYLLKENINGRLYKKLKNYPDEDVAYNFQKNLEEEVTRFAEFWLKKTNIRNLCLAGGIFANVSLNKRISELKDINSLYIFPHMGDGGLSLGAALAFLKPNPFYFRNIYLGPEYNNGYVEKALYKSGLNYCFLKESDLCNKVAQLLFAGKVVAHFYGRIEYGPRALGNRSVLYRADDPSCKGWLNNKLKRTHFMPFAPVSVEEEVDKLYVGIDKVRYSLRFMNVAVDCSEEMKEKCPGAVHIDGTARPQVLYKKDNPRLYKILQIYKGLQGVATVINTSFNRHEEPIVCSAQDAIQSFLDCDLDYLVLNNFLAWKKRA